MPRSFTPRRSVDSARKAPARRARSYVRAVRGEEPAAESTKETPLELPSFTDVLFQQGLLSPDHKRGLILAHAHARHARPKVNRWVYFSSVALCSAILLAGWWLTVGSWVRSRTQLVDTSAIQRQIGTESARLEQAYLGPKPTQQNFGRSE